MNLYKPQYKLNKYHDSLCSKLVMLKGDEDIYRKVFCYKNYFFHNKNNDNLSNSIIYEKNLELKNIFKKFEYNIINKNKNKNNYNTFYSKIKNFLNIKNVKVNERQKLNPIRLKKNKSTINIKNINKKDNNLIFHNFYNEKSLFDSNNGIIFNKNRFNTYNKRLKFITKNFMEIPIIEKVIKNDKKIFDNKKKNINNNKLITKMRNNSENNLINEKLFKLSLDNNYIKNKRKYNRINNISLLNNNQNNNLFTNFISKNKKYNSLDNLNFNLIKFNFIRNNKIIKKFNFVTSFSSNDILNKNNNKKIKN